MKLREILHILEEVGKKIEVPTIFCCGGTPRDKFMGHLENVSDIDLTNGTKTISYVAQEFAATLKKQYNMTYKVMPDGHASIFLGNLKMDFSSNFVVPNIDKYLNEKKITNPTDLQKEMFSRDFTCNALLMSLDLKNIYDPTRRGFQDIKDKKIMTCLDPKTTLTSNRNRVVRAIYLASKLDFDIVTKIIEFVKKFPRTVKISTQKAMIEKLNEAFDKDADKASYYITKMNLWSEIPITEVMQPYYNKNISSPTKIAYFQGGGGVNEPTPGKQKYKSEKAIVIQPRIKEPIYFNYDLYDVEGADGEPKHGPGSGYSSMQDYKSVQEFLKARRKKMKDKYKADDSWVEGNIKSRANLLLKLIASDRNNLDFPIDEQIGNDFIIGDSTTYTPPSEIGSVPNSIDNAVMPGDIGSGTIESYPASVPIGGLGDPYIPLPDTDNKQETALNFGEDLTENEEPTDIIDEKILKSLMNKYLNPAESDIFGLPSGITPTSDLDPNATIDIENPDYGTTNSGNTLYNNTWI